ncbi:uncharacterized protein N7506_007058 [Penicillium brevicompactum]|uniref:uncharacterized protein n=1 Tax=Penicillium brevicompactum TaxID=5074 RepID=UPI002542440B|nr:uncharacterized protein N7506_007058 [Penicillium brevicompactum]KAJ5333275.1 hypothetical protein N7506_007058 [Penicillium brevicompactum]
MARDEEIHGKKRPAPADPDAQPLAKRFGRLRIDNRVPIAARAKSKGDSDPSPPSDTMLLDDTPHTTYIHNLEQELADVDSPGLVFAPFAEKVLSVPQSVLYTKPTGTEVVLYTEPTSLTVPQDHDNVRKAILESRARARERNTTAALSRTSDPVPTDTTTTMTTMAPETTEGEGDEHDAMEIDE